MPSVTFLLEDRHAARPVADGQADLLFPARDRIPDHRDRVRQTRRHVAHITRLPGPRVDLERNVVRLLGHDHACGTPATLGDVRHRVDEARVVRDVQLHPLTAIGAGALVGPEQVLLGAELGLDVGAVPDILAGPFPVAEDHRDAVERLTQGHRLLAQVHVEPFDRGPEPQRAPGQREADGCVGNDAATVKQHGAPPSRRP
jgi:hypothetical protein